MLSDGNPREIGRVRSGAGYDANAGATHASPLHVWLAAARGGE